jgi:hypothetical protein
MSGSEIPLAATPSAGYGTTLRSPYRNKSLWTVLLAVTFLGLVAATQTHADDCLAEAEPNDTPAAATPIGNQRCLSGSLAGNDQDFFLWSLSAERALSSYWQFELEGGADNLTKVVVFRADRHGQSLTPVRVYTFDAEGGRIAKTPPLLFAPGDYLFGITKGASNGGYRLQLRPGQQLPEAGDQEPNDRPDQATPIAGEFAVSGDLAGSVDHFRWTIPDTGDGGLWRLRFQSGVGQSVRLRIYGAKQNVLVERSPGPEGIVDLPDLRFAAGAYDIEISPPSSTAAPYVLEASTQALASPGREVEPNDTLQTAFPLDAGLAVRGRLVGADRDNYTFEISGAPMLWRVTVLAKDRPVSVVRCYSGGRTIEQQVRAGSDRTTRMDNLLLLPGKHFVEVEGTDTPYLLKLAPIGPADLTQRQEAGTKTEGGPRPPGALELEPNDAEDRANPLRAGMPRVGTLPQADDRDVYAFHVGADRPIRVKVTPPGRGQVSLRLAAGSGPGPSDASTKHGEPAVFEGVLRTGDYTVTVQPQGAMEGYYQILLELLDPLQTASDVPSPVSVSLTSEAPAVAAYRLEGQRLTLQVGLENTSGQGKSVRLEAATSDRGWVPGITTEAVTLAPGERKRVPLIINVAPDVRDDQPVMVTVAAATDAAQRSTASIALTADC